MRPTTLTATALVLLAVSATALAQTDDEKNTARALAAEAQDAMDHGDAKTAEDRYHRAVQIFDNAKAVVPPTLLLGYARGAAKNNHFITAEEAYNRIIRAGLPPGAPPPFVKALDDAKREIDAVIPRIARVTITASGCDSPVVTLDGTPVSSVVLGIKKPIDPGSHEVKATAAGCKTATASFTVGEGKESVAALTMEKEAATTTNTNTTTATGTNTTSTTGTTATNTNTTTTATTAPGADGGSGGGSGLKIAGFTSLAIGGVGLVMGFVTGGLALGKHDDLVKLCGAGGTNCPSSADGPIGEYHTLGALSTVGFIVGGVALAAGITMIVLAPSSKKSNAAYIAPYFGFGSLGATGRF